MSGTLLPIKEAKKIVAFMAEHSDALNDHVAALSEKIQQFRYTWIRQHVLREEVSERHWAFIGALRDYTSRGRLTSVSTCVCDGIDYVCYAIRSEGEGSEESTSCNIPAELFYEPDRVLKELGGVLIARLQSLVARERGYMQTQQAEYAKMAAAGANQFTLSAIQVQILAADAGLYRLCEAAKACGIRLENPDECLHD